MKDSIRSTFLKAKYVEPEKKEPTYLEQLESELTSCRDNALLDMSYEWKSKELEALKDKDEEEYKKKKKELEIERKRAEHNAEQEVAERRFPEAKELLGRLIK